MASVLFIFFILFISINFTKQSPSETFFSVSTTDRPSDNCLDLEYRVKKLEDSARHGQDASKKHSITPNGSLPRNCKEVQQRGYTESTFYQIQPLYAPEPFTVLCNMKSKGGGWTYILNRFDGSVGFYRDWNSYKQGFGNLTGEFWLGLEKIHLLTGYEYNELLIELVDWNDVQAFARYRFFGVDDENHGYSLKILEGFSGDAGDSFKYNAGMKFTTKDNDNDKWNEGNCGVWSDSGWWHNSCKSAQLTGIYRPRNYGSDPSWKSMHWSGFKGSTYSLKQARMMVRPIEPTGKKNPAL